MPIEEQVLQVAIGSEKRSVALRVPDAAKAAPPLPAVLVCDDLRGDKKKDGLSLIDALAVALAEAGVAAACIAARKPDGSLPACASDLVDAASAVFRRLLLHDDLDEDRIGLVGRGAGAIVACALAARTDHVNRLCLLSPMTGADLKGPNGAAAAAAESLGPDLVASLAELTPLEDVAVYDQPTLILHGATDRTTPPESALPYLHALRRADRDVSYELIAFGDHDFSLAEAREVCAARIAAFFRAMTAAPVAGART